MAKKKNQNAAASARKTLGDLSESGTRSAEQDIADVHTETHKSQTDGRIAEAQENETPALPASREVDIVEDGRKPQQSTEQPFDTHGKGALPQPIHEVAKVGQGDEEDEEEDQEEPERARSRNAVMQL
jgi:hypothetical protein